MQDQADIAAAAAAAVTPKRSSIRSLVQEQKDYIGVDRFDEASRAAQRAHFSRVETEQAKDVFDRGEHGLKRVVAERRDDRSEFRSVRCRNVATAWARQ